MTAARNRPKKAVNVQPPTQPPTHAIRTVPGASEVVAAAEMDRLAEWWQDLATEEAAKVVPKAIEYSAADLDIMGHVLTKWPPVPPVVADESAESTAWGQELSCAFYTLGKIARAFGAYAEGRRPSDDCWHDIGVYVRMIQRIRESGGWPG